MKAIPFLLIIITSLSGVLSGCRPGSTGQLQPSITFCNPLDLDYRFALDEPSRREAADPIASFNENGTREQEDLVVHAK